MVLGALSRAGSVAPAFLLLLALRRFGPGTTTSLLLVAVGAGTVAAGWAAGLLADRAGPRRTVMLACGGTALLSAAAAACPWPAAFVALAAAASFTGGCVRPAVMTWLMEAVEPERRMSAAGWAYWAHNVAAAVAPAASGLLLAAGTAVPLVVQAVAALGCLALARAVPVPSGVRPGRAGSAVPDGRTRGLAPFLLAAFLVAVVYLQKQGALPLALTGAGWDSAAIGALLAVNGVVVVAVQPLAGRLVPRVGTTAAFVAAALLVGAGFAAHGLPGGFAVQAAAVVVWSLGEVLQAPTAVAHLAKIAPAGRAGAAQGAYSSTWNLGLVLGAPAGQALLAAAPAHLWTACLACGVTAAALHLRTARSASPDPP
ncbi:MFS transporter [Bailinhaonella thermotolerans]|uniref:MFS transporter n=2 Tax=Bailinhaonella thermotolerans TaxID=1070861 RepID=A0A3A4B436_9ACTN|nr:MFS transporter [Bailinhaonella thermotolerans]